MGKIEEGHGGKEEREAGGRERKQERENQERGGEREGGKRKKVDNSKELVPMTTDAPESQDLQGGTGGWRPRTAGDSLRPVCIYQRVLRPRRANRVLPVCWAGDSGRTMFLFK